ncbi:sodium:dicarboxylate symporter [Gemmatimonadetes bacterium T265]|nr:sodium:dicarboxylate symporter [Gemmatimonadetes bacterium T265]
MMDRPSAPYNGPQPALRTAVPDSTDQPVARARRLPSATVLALLALAAGTALGAVATSTHNGALAGVVDALAPLGALWVNAIRMTLVPLVVSMLVTSVAGVADVGAVGRLGVRALVWFVVLLAGCALIAALAAPTLFRYVPVDASAAAALRAHATAAAGTPAEVPTLGGFLTGLVPANPLKAAVDGAMLPLIVFTLLFAAAVTRLAPEPRALVTGFFRAVSEAMLVVVGWVLALTPIGVLALAAGLGRDLGAGAIGAVGGYVLILCGLVTVVTLLCYPVAAAFGRVSMRTFARAVLPAQAVAVSSRSSLASLPALIAGFRATLGERPAVTGFVLPLAVSTFKLDTPVADLAGPLFLAHLYGVPLGPAQIATMTLVTVAMSFSNPGIPSGGLFVVTAPVLLAVGLPLDGIGLLIAADAIPDVFNTLVNVTGDMTVATILARDAEA